MVSVLLVMFFDSVMWLLMLIWKKFSDRLKCLLMWLVKLSEVFSDFFGFRFCVFRLCVIGLLIDSRWFCISWLFVL